MVQPEISVMHGCDAAQSEEYGLLTWEYAILKFDDHPREVLMLDVPGPATGVSTSCDMVADNSSIAPRPETSRAHS